MSGVRLGQASRNFWRPELAQVNSSIRGGRMALDEESVAFSDLKLKQNQTMEAWETSCHPASAIASLN